MILCEFSQKFTWWVGVLFGLALCLPCFSGSHTPGMSDDFNNAVCTIWWDIETVCKIKVLHTLTMPLHGKDHWNEMAFLKLPITHLLAFGFGPAYFNRNCLCLVTSPKLQKLLNIDPLSSWEILALHLYLQFMPHPHFIFLACLVLPRWLIKSFPWFLRLFVIFLAHSFSFLTIFLFYHLLYYHHVHLLSHQPSLTLLHQYLPVHLLSHPLSL